MVHFSSVYVVHRHDCCLVFTPIQDRSRASKYQVSPDLQHVLFAFEVKPVSDKKKKKKNLKQRPSVAMCHTSFVVTMRFVSADIPTFLFGQVHYLQPCDTVSSASSSVLVSHRPPSTLSFSSQGRRRDLSPTPWRPPADVTHVSLLPLYYFLAV